VERQFDRAATSLEDDVDGAAKLDVDQPVEMGLAD
jgi:hypothetical protein